MSSMIEEFKGIIEKNLPEEVGNILKEQLGKIPSLEAEIKDLKSEIATQANRLGALEIEKYDLKIKVKTLSEYENRLSKIEEKERNQKVFEAETLMRSAVENAKSLFGLVDKVMGNEKIIFSTHCSQAVPAKDQFGNIITQYHSHDVETKISKEK